MDAQIPSLIQTVLKHERLAIDIRLHDRVGFATLGHDLQALDAIQFAGATAELLFSYLVHVSGSNTPIPYSPEIFRGFENELSREYPGITPTWLEAYDNALHHEEFFGNVFRYRDGGMWSAASSEILRIELQDVHKENPTVLKMIALGSVTALVLLTGTLGGTWIKKLTMRISAGLNS